MQYGTFLTGADGWIEVGSLQPGIYSATARVADPDGSMVTLVSAGTVEIAPGAVNDCEFGFHRRRVVLRLVADESGRALGGRTCFVTSGDERSQFLGGGFFGDSRLTDALGMLRYEAAAAGLHRITAFRDQERRTSEPFTIEERPPGDPIEVRLKLAEPPR